MGTFLAKTHTVAANLLVVLMLAEGDGWDLGCAVVRGDLHWFVLSLP